MLYYSGSNNDREVQHRPPTPAFCSTPNPTSPWQIVLALLKIFAVWILNVLVPRPATMEVGQRHGGSLWQEVD